MIRSNCPGASIALLLSLGLQPALGNDHADAHDASALMESFSWRGIGPAVFGGRIVDLQIHPKDRSYILAASASGGLWRTRNHGVSWECIFENEGTLSIGDIAFHPDDTDTIWVGTGEANNQRSSYWGDGVYKTTDGGETWTNTGLHDSHHIGRIVIHPEDPDTVFVAALGHLYTPNEERGLYRTRDGGKSWSRVLFVDEDTGFVDVSIDHEKPDVIIAASYERRRRAWDFDGNGPGSGIWRSEDGGDTWDRVASPLPEGDVGRIGVAHFPGDSSIVYATVSNQNRVEVPQKEPVSIRTAWDDGIVVREVQEGGGAAELGIEKGDILLQLGEVELTSSFAGVAAIARYKNQEEEVDLVYRRGDEQQTKKVSVAKLLRYVPNEPKFREVGGEIYRSTDRGVTWEKRNEKSAGGSPAYYYGQIRVDPIDPETVYVMSVPLLRSTDGGATWSNNIAGSVHVDHHALEIDPEDPRRLVLGNDGGMHFSFDGAETWQHVNNLPISQFYAVGVDYDVPYNVYGGTQDNGTWGGPSAARSRRGITNRDWYSIGGGDGFYAVPDPRNPDTVYAESQFGVLYRRDLATWTSRSIRPRQRDEHSERYRFNWNSPIVVSHHNPEIIYFGGNRLFKSFDRGDTWAIVTDDLTTADPEKLEGNVPHCTITTVSESRFDPSLVIVGTDDGLVQVSRDGCLTWTNLAGRFPGVPSNWWVNRVVLSRHDAETGYVVFTGYREDDFAPYVYRSTDGLQTWQPIHAGLPHEPVNVIREDPRNPAVLYLGTELGAYVSLDAGETWGELGSGLPRVSVYDLLVHDRDGDVVIGTHGRGFWILDATVIHDLSEENLAKDAHLFDVKDVVRLGSRDNFSFSGDAGFVAPNPPGDARITVWLGRDMEKGEAELIIEDLRGSEVRELKLPREKGLHSVEWSTRSRSRGRRGGASGPPPPRDGTYRAVLRVKDAEPQTVTFSVASDPGPR